MPLGKIKVDSTANQIPSLETAGPQTHTKSTQKKNLLEIAQKRVTCLTHPCGKGPFENIWKANELASLSSLE